MESKLGVSTACYYPLETEKSLSLVGSFGFKNTELFLNSHSELKDDFINELLRIKDKNETNIVSVHPFQSFAESFYLFSNYERRWTDSLPLYNEMFAATEKLGAKYFVFHGAKIPGSVDDEEYCKRFAHLIKMGQEHGITVCHENVVLHRGESPSYLKRMADYIGDSFKIVYDTKQALRAGYTEEDFFKRLSDRIVHIHISDRNKQSDCITPLKGEFDFKSFFEKTKNFGYNGKYIIELYNWSYSSHEEIKASYTELEKILSNI